MLCLFVTGVGAEDGDGFVSVFAFVVVELEAVVGVVVVAEAVGACAVVGCYGYCWVGGAGV